MSGLPYSNMRGQIQNGVSSQYGVGTPFSGASPVDFSSIGASMLGSGIGFGLNLLGSGIQNSVNEAIYNSHYSPAARLREMRAAGINPNAAAQGVSGSSASEYSAASLSEGNGVASNIADLLGNSVNSEITARNLNANTRHTDQLTEREKLGTAFDSATFDERVMQVALQNKWTKEQTEQMRSFNKYADQLYSWNAQKAEQDCKNAEKQWHVYAAQIGLYEKEGEYYDEMTGEAKARTAKVWKEVEFQKWWNNYCTQNNMQPDSPEAEYIRNKLVIESAPSDSEERKAAERWVETYEKSISDIKQSESSGNRIGAATPQTALMYEYDSILKSELFQIDDELNRLNFQLYSASTKSERWKIHAKIEYWNYRRRKALRDARTRMRRIHHGGSAGVSVAGTGFNASD